MRYAIVDTVTGLVEQVGDYSPDYQPPEGFAIIPSEQANIGWQLVDGDLLAPDDMSISPVPDSVTLAQARAALMQAGLFAQVDAAVQASGNPVALMAWEYTNTVSRTGALVQALAPATGLTEAQIDDLFRAAAAIQL